MNYSIKNINGCTRSLSFNFDAVDLSNEINISLKEKQKTASLKGYRVGKAPLSVIQNLYGPEVENDALYRFVTKEYYNAIEKEGLSPVGYPKFENTKYEAESKNIAFDATVEVYPEFELSDFSSFEFKRDSDTVQDSDLEAVKEQYLNSKAEVKPITDESITLEKGMVSIMNFEGEKADGEKPENMKGKEFSLEIGSNQFIPGFEEKMVGMKKGEKKTIELTFPKDYQAEDLQGAEVKFHVEVLEIKEKVKPAFDDEFAKQFDFESAEDFLTKTKNRLELESKRKADEKLHQEILEKLVEENKFDVPVAMIANQVKALQDETAQSLKQNGFNDEMIKDYFSKWGTDFNTKAEFQVKSGLILNKLADKYAVETNEADLEAKYQEMSNSTGMELTQIKELYGAQENIVKNLQYAIREEKTFAQLKKEITVK